MNNKYQDLARAAGLLVHNPDLMPTKLQKFAELLVRECISIAQDRAAFDGFPPNDVNHVIDEIKLHFGVDT